MFGAVNEEFAFGTPEKCADKYDISYLGSLYIYHGCQWLVIFVIGYLGIKYGPLIMIVSCALSGATLTVAANVTLARTILTYIGWSKTLGKINVLFTNYGTIAIYVIMALGCLSMLMIRGFVKEMKKQEAIKKVQPAAFVCTARSLSPWVRPSTHCIASFARGPSHRSRLKLASVFVCSFSGYSQDDGFCKVSHHTC
jgi:hypothetical protein